MSDAKPGHIERRKELMGSIGSLLLSNAGSGKRGRLMRQCAEWIARIESFPTDANLDEMEEELSGWDQ